MGQTMRRRKKPYDPAEATRVHDRRSTDLLRNAQAAPVEVEDPYEAGAKIVAMQSIRDNPLIRMHVHKQIDDAQYQGGLAWQADYEVAEIGGARAIDPTKEAVDGGKLPEMLTERQQKAFDGLSKAARELGQFGCSLVHDVLAERKFIEQVAIERGFDNQRSIDYYGRRFRECLETLALVYGFAMIAESRNREVLRKM